MKIQQISNNRINFCSRNENTKKADDILRQTKRTFPLMSHSYVETFYKSYSNENTKNRAKEIRNKLYLTLRDSRKRVYEKIKAFKRKEGLKLQIPYKADIDEINKTRVGNCQENAIAALAMLCMNGYYNSDLVELVCITDVTNKKDSSISYRHVSEFDHVFALTDMNTGKKNIVVDPWLGFSATSDEAMGKFKCVFDERDFLSAKYNAMGEICFKLDISEEQLEDEYEIKQKMGFRPIEHDIGILDLVIFGEYVKKILSER